jgi:hypothetical protein
MVACTSPTVSLWHVIRDDEQRVALVYLLSFTDTLFDDGAGLLAVDSKDARFGTT